MVLDKTDFIRLLDVILIGPLMIQASTKLPGYQGQLLWWSGLGTILYNGYNLLQNVTAKRRLAHGP